MKRLFGTTYKNRRVLITGHTGFVGAWLTFILKELGASVIGCSLDPPTEPNLYSILNISDNIVDLRVDIRDKEKLQGIFNEFKPEIVFHLAAQPIVLKSYEEPEETFTTNVSGTFNILDCCRDSSDVKAVVNITSDKCYEDKQSTNSYNENDKLGGSDVYSASKACSEILSSSYRQSFFNKTGILLATIRAGNIIGGGDWGEHRLIPDCVKALNNGENVIIRNPNSIRAWQFILEPVFVHLLIGAKLLQKQVKFADAWNVGPKKEDCAIVEDVVRYFIKCYNFKGDYVVVPNEDIKETKVLILDSSKLKEAIGWENIYDIDTTLQKTAEWYKEYYNNQENIIEFSLKQIKEYVDDMLNKQLKIPIEE